MHEFEKCILLKSKKAVLDDVNLRRSIKKLFEKPLKKF